MKGIILKNQNGYFSIAGEGEQLTEGKHPQML